MNIPVIMYHSINNFKDQHPQGFLAFDEKEFEIHLRILKFKNYKIVTLKEAFELSQKELRTNKYAVLTFDDGFYDNLTIVSSLLEKHDIKATVFINTDMLDQMPRKTNHFDWGFLNSTELVELHRKARFDVQSHTHTHNRVFVSNKIVDFYDEANFDKYYWLVWLYFPELKKEWSGDVRRFKSKIPKGFPILENDRSIVAKEYKISFEDLNSKVGQVLNEVNDGRVESDKEYEKRVVNDLKVSQDILNQLLNIKVEHVCFPGGAYNDYILKEAQRLEYKSYMLASKYEGGNNIKELISNSHLKQIARISFTLDYPKGINSYLASLLSVFFKLEYFEGKKFTILIFRVLKKIRNLLK